MPLTVTIEATDRPTQFLLGKLQWALNAAEEDLGACPTRQNAANVAWRAGLAYFIGGHHVAVHRKNRDGSAGNFRLALITGTGEDWQ